MGWFCYSLSVFNGIDSVVSILVMNKYRSVDNENILLINSCFLALTVLH